MRLAGRLKIDINGLERWVVLIRELKQDSLPTRELKQHALAESLSVVLSVKHRPRLFDLFRRDIRTVGSRGHQNLRIGFRIEEIQFGTGTPHWLLLKVAVGRKGKTTGFPSLGRGELGEQK